MNQVIKEFASRKDVIFGVVGATATAMLVYSDRLPVWALLVIVALREVFGAIALAKSK